MSFLSDLHVHLLGAIPAELVTSLYCQYRGTPREPWLNEAKLEFLLGSELGMQLLSSLDTPIEEDRFRALLTSYKTLPEFLACFVLTSSLIRGEQDFEILVDGVVQQFHEWKLDYCEITVSPSHYIGEHLSIEKFLGILKNSSSPSGTAIRWLVDPIRNRGPEYALHLLQRAVEIDPDIFSGASLAGDERSFPATTFQEYFDFARTHGLGTTIHSGEGRDPQLMHEILDLSVDRIGHGIAVIYDEALVDRFREEEVVFEVCPTGNVRTGIHPSLEEHPIRQMVDLGLTVTVNSDDPFFFETSTIEEYRRLQGIFSEEELQLLQKNSQQAAFAL